jgi:hypothetical protein
VSEISRRDFLKLIGNLAVVLALNRLGLANAEGQSTKPETAELLLSRKEHFKPFNRGNAEWQYVEFQYTNANNQHIGVTISMSELTDLSGNKTQQLLVMHHNLDTGETINNPPYSGTLIFDEATSTYTFTDSQNKQLAEFSYNEREDTYSLKIKTREFNSDMIDSNGLVLRPQGNLIPVSKDGNFTVASFEGGRVFTNYYADHIRVEKQNGDIVGYGRRDSENLELDGLPPTQLDIDHTWVHASGMRADGKRFFITAWESNTGGQFRFADILIIDPVTGNQESFTQLNEGDSGFKVGFTSNLAEQEIPPGQSNKPEYKMAHGGQVMATLGDKTLFVLEVDGNFGQIIGSKGFLSMVEAHGKVKAGWVLGSPVSLSDSAIWETTDEKYSAFLPIIQK